MREAEITAKIDKHQLMGAVYRMTIRDPDFDPGPWSIDDAETFERAAALIRREIVAKEAPRA